jgi:hypothetical protein
MKGIQADVGPIQDVLHGDRLIAPPRPLLRRLLLLRCTRRRRTGGSANKATRSTASDNLGTDTCDHPMWTLDPSAPAYHAGHQLNSYLAPIPT